MRRYYFKIYKEVSSMEIILYTLLRYEADDLDSAIRFVKKYLRDLKKRTGFTYFFKADIYELL